jgi:anti-anti-sigma factor
MKRLCGLRMLGRIESMLRVMVENVDEMTILRCLGRIVRGNETAILCSAVQQEGRKVVVDLAGVDAVDAAGIGALVSLQAAGVYLTLMNPTDQVREILKLTKLDSIFEICESQSTAATTESTQAGYQPISLRDCCLPPA